MLTGLQAVVTYGVHKIESTMYSHYHCLFSTANHKFVGWFPTFQEHVIIRHAY